MDRELREQLTAYITENQDRFYRILYSHIADKEAIPDIMQNAVVKALENGASIRHPEYMGTWFYRVLLNECYGYMRKSRREYACAPEMIAEMRGAEQVETRDIDVFRQVQMLPDKLKTVVILRFYEDLSLKEIAMITKSGIGAVKYRLYAGLRRIEKSLKEAEK